MALADTDVSASHPSCHSARRKATQTHSSGQTGSYTVTILRDGANPQGAAVFVAFLLGPEGRAVMRDHGLDVTPPTTSGDAEAIPPAVRTGIAAAP